MLNYQRVVVWFPVRNCHAAIGWWNARLGVRNFRPRLGRVFSLNFRYGHTLITCCRQSARTLPRTSQRSMFDVLDWNWTRSFTVFVCRRLGEHMWPPAVVIPACFWGIGLLPSQTMIIYIQTIGDFSAGNKPFWFLASTPYWRRCALCCPVELVEAAGGPKWFWCH